MCCSRTKTLCDGVDVSCFQISYSHQDVFTPQDANVSVVLTPCAEKDVACGNLISFWMQ